MTLLYGASPQTLDDPDGFTYRVFPVYEDSNLQSLIDGVTLRLLTTAIGTSICRDLLNGDPALIARHLGISGVAADASAMECSQASRAKVTSPAVHDANQDSSRLMGLNGTPKRRYVIVVTNRPDVAIDSWTEAFSNVTTLFLHHSSERSDLNLLYLSQAIAHEMAIYFDGKAWPWGPDWHRVRELESTRILGPDLHGVQSAALNPAIATVLAFIRAYKVERQMIRELGAQGKLGPDPIYYPVADYPFLRLNCGNECLKNYILEQRSWLSSLYRPLLAFAPHYRVRRLEQERATALLDHTGLDELLYRVLEIIPVKYIQTANRGGMFFEHFTKVRSAEDIAEDGATAKVMISSLLPSDLKLLASSRVELSYINSKMDLLSFLTIPVLTDANSGISSGPRPRIRTGGTQ